MVHVLKTSMALALCVLASACSDDDGGADAPSNVDAGAAGAGGDAATTGDDASTGATGDAVAVECGSEMCMTDGLVAMFGAEACCFDASAGVCGTSMAGGECIPPADPGTPDERCTPDIAGSPLPLSGCCIQDMCGIDLGLLGQGCIEFADLAGLAGMFGAGSGFELPESRRCDEPPPDGDAGTEDDGGG